MTTSAPAAPATPAAPVTPATEPSVAEPTLLDPANDPKGGDASGKAPNAKPEGSAAAPAKPDGGAQEPAKKPEEGEKPAGAPEKYADFKLPEGVLLDPAVATEFQTVAKEMNLSQEQAQKLVDLQAKVSLQTVEQANTQFKEQIKAWEEQTKKDLGPKFDAERALAAKGRDKVATPELLKLLNDTGMGSHPEVFKLFAKLGKSVAEDTFVEGKPENSKPEAISTANVLYGKTKK